MIISDRYQFVYYDPPKTASTAIDKFFIQKYGGVAQKRLNRGAVRTKHARKPAPKGYLRIASVRNPFKRATSYYFFQKHMPHSQRVMLMNEAAFESFDTWLDFLIENNKKDTYTQDSIEYIYFPQWKFLEPMGYDKIIKVESINEDLSSLPFVKNHVVLPKSNTTQKYPKWSELETPERKEKIIAWAGKDFELFGYETT
jgi:hypothetical protein